MAAEPWGCQLRLFSGQLDEGLRVLVADCGPGREAVGTDSGLLSKARFHWNAYRGQDTNIH